jgi:hypothetical protein
MFAALVRLTLAGAAFLLASFPAHAGLFEDENVGVAVMDALRDIAVGGVLVAALFFSAIVAIACFKIIRDAL